ncbi:MAG: hypothetical protein HFI34_03825 [Lachnospiraceae bacterium]|nr:hypothetical protein [Lachnospiraceae bacterium]
MKKLKKVLGAAGLSAIVAIGMLGNTMVSKAESFTTTGGKYNKTWDCSLSSTKHGGAIYRLTGSAVQPEAYKYDNVRIEVVLYCNSTSNVVKKASAVNAYKISASADAAISISSGKGTALISVSDDTYGSMTKRIYN